MFIGHIGAGLAAKKYVKSINLSWLVFISLFLDFLLGILVILGLESILIPDNYSDLHYLMFSFPFSHSLFALFLMAAFLFLGVYFIPKFEKKFKIQAAIVLTLLLISHWVLDIIVHEPDIAVDFSNKSMIGFGLWNHLLLALILEVGILLGGIILYLKSKKDLQKMKLIILIVVLSLLTIFNVAGVLFVSEAPNPNGAALSFVFQPMILFFFFRWVDK